MRKELRDWLKFVISYFGFHCYIINTITAIIEQQYFNIIILYITSGENFLPFTKSKVLQETYKFLCNPYQDITHCVSSLTECNH